MGRRLAASLPLVISCTALSCSSGEEPGATYDHGLFPRVAYSGFNPSASFKVLFATGASAPQWSVDDPSVATIAPSARPSIAGVDVSALSFALVTPKRAGETTVTVASGGRIVRARLVVKAYSDEQLAAGKARYEADSPDPARRPCAACHATSNGVDHSPLKMAGFDDATILGVVQEATYPASPTGQSTTSAYAPTGPLKFAEHKWNLAAPERDGILAHMRSLPLGGL